jgi:hypothetical protein
MPYEKNHLNDEEAGEVAVGGAIFCVVMLVVLVIYWLI